MIITTTLTKTTTPKQQQQQPHLPVQVGGTGLRVISFLGWNVDDVDITRYGCVRFILSGLLHHSVYRYVLTSIVGSKGSKHGTKLPISVR